MEAYLSPPEELIIKKLQYFRDGGSEKHARDIRSMLTISPDQIDHDRLEQLVDSCNLRETWSAVMSPGG
ncbi:hypothetical protein BH23GEM11_BH23GEM11_19020 [soil metagenome]